MPAESYYEKIETLMSLRAALASCEAVSSMDINLNERGQLTGHLSLRHNAHFFEFNNLLGEYPIRVVSIRSVDKLRPDGSHLDRDIEIRVAIAED